MKFHVEPIDNNFANILRPGWMVDTRLKFGSIGDGRKSMAAWLCLRLAGTIIIYGRRRRALLFFANYCKMFSYLRLTCACNFVFGVFFVIRRIFEAVGRCRVSVLRRLGSTVDDLYEVLDATECVVFSVRRTCTTFESSLLVSF